MDLKQRTCPTSWRSIHCSPPRNSPSGSRSGSSSTTDPPEHRRLVREAIFPLEIVPEMAELGLLGMHLKGYGCAGRCAVEYGLAALELEAGDSGLRTFVSVQGSLAMSAIHKYGSEEQKHEWLPRMAAGELIGCFGAHRAHRRLRPGRHEDLRPPGRRRRLGAERRQAVDRAGVHRRQVAVIWARPTTGSAGSSSPPSTPGFTATPIETKLSMRASIQCDIALTDVRLPADAVLPERAGAEWAVLLPERGPVRDHLGRDGRGPRLLRDRAGVLAAAAAVRQAAGRLPAHPAQARRHGAGDPEGHPPGAAPGPAQGRREAAARADLVSAS